MKWGNHQENVTKELLELVCIEDQPNKEKSEHWWQRNINHAKAYGIHNKSKAEDASQDPEANKIHNDFLIDNRKRELTLCSQAISHYKKVLQYHEAEEKELLGEGSTLVSFLLTRSL